MALTNRVVRRRGEPPRPRAAIVKTIANALRLDFRKVLAMSEDVKRRYQPLAISSDPEAHNILADSHLVAGVSIEDRQIRQYLHGRRLSHVLGSVNNEHHGSAGIELKYDKYLTGVPGEIHGMKDARGRELYDKRIISVDPIPGADIYLTIDHTLQYEAETALAAGMEEFQPGSGWCLVMDAKTGAVLAMASLPDFDPLRFGAASDSAKQNRVTNFTYEPGSVMKVITAAAAFDSGFADPGRMYSTQRFDERYYKLPGDGSHVWDPMMSVKDAIVHSSNIVIGKLGYDLGPQRLWLKSWRVASSLTGRIASHILPFTLADSTLRAKPSLRLLAISNGVTPASYCLTLWSGKVILIIKTGLFESGCKSTKKSDSKVSFSIIYFESL